jgi:fatty acid desaturase
VLKPWISMLAVFGEWLLIFIAIFIHQSYTNIFVYFFVWIIIASRLYAFYSLIHEAIHYCIFRNKALNDFIAQLFLGLPLLLSVKQMRKTHLTHHKYLQTDKDPEMQHLLYKEFHFPATKSQLLRLFFLDITGVNFIYYKFLKILHLFNSSKRSKLDLTDLFLIFTYFVIAFLLGFGKELLLYWLIPYATFYQLLNRIRLSTEHFNLKENSPFKTRSVIPDFLESFFLTPYNLGYHAEHHLFPGVPFYNLPILHHKLMNQTYYSSNAVVYKSYSNVLKEFIKQ